MSRSETLPEAVLEESTSDRAWWAYCVLPTQDCEAVDAPLEGIEPESSVQTVSEGELAALVSSVPLDEFGDEQLRQHLEDIQWVEQTARRHEVVLEAALATATIVPLRLCTLYRDLAGVRRLLREHGGALSESLERVEGCTEWGVKVFAPPLASARASQAPPSASDRPGATYLLQRQQERAQAEEASQDRAECVEAVHRRVAGLARGATSNPPQRRELHGRDLTMLLNGAYLIERSRVGELEQAIDDLQEQWKPHRFVIEPTGPWPPYNFVSGSAGVMP